jgi:DNA-binding NarL/FixJ family response regulator
MGLSLSICGCSVLWCPCKGLPVQILIADDHPLYREALRARVERIFPDAKITEAGSLNELSRDNAKNYQLLLLDYHMPGMSAEILKKLTTDFPDLPVAIISGSSNSADVRDVVAAGARGFIPKTASGPHLLSALQILLAGGTSVPADSLGPIKPETAKSIEGNAPWLASLTHREREVLVSLVRGLSNKEIGRELGLAEVTVKLHLRTIFRKIGARSRAEAAVLASKAELG